MLAAELFSKDHQDMYFQTVLPIGVFINLFVPSSCLRGIPFGSAFCGNYKLKARLILPRTKPFSDMGHHIISFL